MKKYKFLNFTIVAKCIAAVAKVKKLLGQILSQNKLIFPTDFLFQFLANFAILAKGKPQ